MRVRVSTIGSFSMDYYMISGLCLLMVTTLPTTHQQTISFDGVPQNLIGQNFPDDCALRLVREIDGPSINDISSQDVIGTDSFCISYSEVNSAFRIAKARNFLTGPPRPASTQVEEAQLAEALLETTRILREKFGLSRDEIWAGLPLLDTSFSDISPWCPIRLALNNRCPGQLKRYRSYDGSCNNAGPLAWFQGSANQPFTRMLPPQYSDGVSSPRVSSSGIPLPNARLVSSKVHRDLGYHDHAVTVMFLAWGQLLDHDITLTAEAKNAITKTEPECCDNPRANKHCSTLSVPADDIFYSRFGQRCMSFLRSPPALKPGCRLGSRAQNNELTGIIDASFVYGSSEAVAKKLRLGLGGQMATLDILPHRLKPLLPLKLENPDEGCVRPSQDIFCFLAGDNRINEQLLLAVLHTIFVREHNRIAVQLSELNPHWSDETLYQETRSIVAAIVQQITYGEFLPLLLGKEAMIKYDLELKTEGYYTNHEEGLDPAVPASFATAAFRFGHSLLPSTLERWSPTHRYIGSHRLSSVLRQPFAVYRPGRIDEILLGMSNQVAQAMDDAVTSEVTTQLFRKPGALFGRDLASINIARAREHGVPSYTSFRSVCGLKVPQTWDELAVELNSNSTAFAYRQIFQSVEDVDLWSAGVGEKPATGSLVGPTFNCILGRAFKHLRKNDRFWFENPLHPGAFTAAQLSSLRRVRLSRLLCDNSDSVLTLQAYSMVLPDPELNPRVPCKSSVLPSLDLSPWIDLNKEIVKR